MIVAAVGVAAACELSALQARERRDHPHGAQTRQACLRCHSGPAWIAKIAEKEGKKATDPLFVDDPAPSSKSAPTGGKCPDSDIDMKRDTTYPGK